MARNKRKNRIANTLAVCFWLCAWQAASVCIGQKLILVSPLEVCGALLALLPTADFWQTAAFSAGRIIGGFLLALALGLALAALAAALRWVEVLLRPLMLTIKSIPVASFIILALMWLRSAGNLAVFISFLMVLPVVYTNTLAGIRETDARLLEMAAVFRVPPAKRGRRCRISARPARWALAFAGKAAWRRRSSASPAAASGKRCTMQRYCFPRPSFWHGPW